MLLNLANREKIKKLLVEIIQLSKILEFSDEDLRVGTKRKSLIIQERLKGEY